MIDLTQGWWLDERGQLVWRPGGAVTPNDFLPPTAPAPADQVAA
jgi:hypothetical protein